MTLFRPEKRAVAFTGSPTYNPFEDPAVPLAAVGLDGMFGATNSDAGETVTPDTALGVATFYRCLFLLSSVVASCPLEEFRSSDHQKITDSASARLFDPANPDMTYTPFELKQLIMVYRLIWGNSCVFKKRGFGPKGPGTGRIVDLKPIYPECVEIDLDEDGNKIFKVKRIKDGKIDNSGQYDTFTTYEIMHIPGLGYDGLQGLSVVSLMKQSVGTAIAADKLAAKFYSQGSQLAGYIKVKVPLASRTQAEGIKHRWMAQHSGLAHAGEVAVLDSETDFQSITIPPNDLQFLESRRWQTTEVARWFGVPPHLVGDVEKSTSWGTGIEQQNLGLHVYTLTGHIPPIEERITREVVETRGHYSKFNLDYLMRGDTAERYAALQLAAGGPWMSRNEARVSENKQPIDKPEYDELLPPQGIGPTGEDNQQSGSND